jgi:hypothetical protein
MKKMMMALALFATVMTTSSFANDTETTVTPKVLKAFKTEFVAAQQVEWTVTKNNYYKATFMLNDQYVFAYYNQDGKFLGLTHYSSSLDLPILLQKEIKTKYADFWITDLFELATYDGNSYYLTLENKENVHVLKSSDGIHWSSFKKDKKS